jgi:hypothetical protein
VAPSTLSLCWVFHVLYPIPVSGQNLKNHNWSGHRSLPPLHSPTLVGMAARPGLIKNLSYSVRSVIHLIHSVLLQNSQCLAFPTDLSLVGPFPAPPSSSMHVTPFAVHAQHKRRFYFDTNSLGSLGSVLPTRAHVWFGCGVCPNMMVEGCDVGRPSYPPLALTSTLASSHCRPPPGAAYSSSPFRWEHGSFIGGTPAQRQVTENRPRSGPARAWSSQAHPAPHISPL